MTPEGRDRQSPLSPSGMGTSVLNIKILEKTLYPPCMLLLAFLLFTLTFLIQPSLLGYFWAN